MAPTDHTAIALSGATEEERARELTALFEDRHLLLCMDAHLENKGERRDPEKTRARRLQALQAFSRNPPEFWDMNNER